MRTNIALLSDDELLEKEASIKNVLLKLEKKQKYVPNSTYKAKINQLYEQLNKVLSELDRRKLL